MEFKTSILGRTNGILSAKNSILISQITILMPVVVILRCGIKIRLSANGIFCLDIEIWAIAIGVLRHDIRIRATMVIIAYLWQNFFIGAG